MKQTKTVGNAQHLESLFPSPEEGVKTFSSFWSSPEKFADQVEKMDRSKAWSDSAWDTDSGDWYGTKSLQEAIDLVHKGWKEGVDKVERLRGAIVAQTPMQLKPAKFGIVGSVPSVPRAVSGNPLNMKTVDPKKSSKRPIITLISDMSANCSHSSAEFVNRAAVVAALIDQIEAAGYSCEVIATAYGQCGNFRIKSHVVVKDSNQPVDVARLAFGIGHPGMFRRLIFAEWGHDHFNEDLGYGLGYNHRIVIGSEEQIKLAEKHMYVLPSINSNRFFATEESAETKGLTFILQSLRAQKFPCFTYKGLPEEDIPGTSDD
jgi:hypothetical protein